MYVIALESTYRHYSSDNSYLILIAFITWPLLLFLSGVPDNSANVRWSKGDMTTITENPSPNAQQLHERIQSERSVEPNSREASPRTAIHSGGPNSEARADTRSVRQWLQHIRRRIRHSVAPSTQAVKQTMPAPEAANSGKLPSPHDATSHRDRQAEETHRSASECIHVHDAACVDSNDQSCLMFLLKVFGCCWLYCPPAQWGWFCICTCVHQYAYACVHVPYCGTNMAVIDLQEGGMRARAPHDHEEPLTRKGSSYWQGKRPVVWCLAQSSASCSPRKAFRGQGDSRHAERPGNLHMPFRKRDV
jgi:hypothetical protein